MDSIDTVRHILTLCKTVLVAYKDISLGFLCLLIASCGFQVNFKLCPCFGSLDFCFPIVGMLDNGNVALDNRLVYIIGGMVMLYGVSQSFCADMVDSRIKQIAFAWFKLLYRPVIAADIFLCGKLTVLIGKILVYKLFALENPVFRPCKGSVPLRCSGLGVALGYGYGKFFQDIVYAAVCNLVPLDGRCLLCGNHIADCGIHFFKGIRGTAAD